MRLGSLKLVSKPSFIESIRKMFMSEEDGGGGFSIVM